ncbi:MAG TPA: HAD family hydrolase [Candidatus Paceibacterota bacterium]|nr:HAD family hydrolase [Candidatus Paceibacterota bacterium]
MIVKACIYDFDGPINDSFREGIRRIKILCAIHEVAFGRAERQRLIESWGLPGVELLMQGLNITRDLAEAMYREWERMDLQDPVPLVPSAKDVLYWMHRNGFRNCLLTTRNRQNIHDIFERVDLMRSFDIMSCRQDVEHRKPDPRAFRYVLEQLQERFGIGRDDCIFIGDTPVDIDAGKQAGIRTLVVQTGPYLLEHVLQYPMDLHDILKSLDDLPQWMEKNHDGGLEHLYD